MNTVPDRCAAAQAVMDHVCNEYMQNPNAQLIDLMLEGQSELQRCGLGAYSQVHPKKTLIHPRNRGHAMLEISSVSAQVADISDVSFSLHEVLQAAAVRMPAIGTAERQAIEKLNENLVSASLGTLAPVVRDDAEIQVVGCSHNTAGLKAICCRAKCEIERISEDGRYNASKIIGRCPSYKSAIEHGLRYFIVEYIVETKWPHFVDLTIEACNIGSSVAKPDTVLQLMSKAHQHALQTVGSNMNSTELYALIERKMARTKPALADMLPEICAYVKDWSGGQNPIFLTALLQFARTLDMPQYDYVNKAMLTKINKIDLGVGLGGRYRVMIIKLCLAKGINGISSAALVSLSKRGTNQHTLAIKAEEEADVFEKAILKISKNDAWGGEVLRQIGLFDNDVVAYVHHMNKKFKSFKEIQAHHFDHILVLLKAKSKNPFRDEQIKKVKGGEPMQKNMQELGATGMSASNLMIVAKGKGLDVGAIVANKGGTYIILSIDEDDSIVTLQLKGDKRRKSTVFLQDLVDNFKPDEEVTKAYAVAAMHTMSTRCSGMGLGQVSVQIKPIHDRKVIVEKDFKAGQFKLYCFSTSLATPDTNKDDVDGAKAKKQKMSVILDGKTHVFNISPPQIPTCMPKEGTDDVVALVPFWFVKPVHESLANTVLTTETHTVGNAKVMVPLLTNPKAISKGELITVSEKA